MTAFTACPYFSMEDDRDYITVYNRSDEDISFYFAFDDAPDFGWFTYPDTSIMTKEVSEYHLWDAIKGNHKRFEISPLAVYYRDTHTDTLCFFILSTDTIAKYDWETIRTEYKILKRYDLSYQNFIKLGYKISYPPNERMKNIKMWPPYP
jgi:hypothetical protein